MYVSYNYQPEISYIYLSCLSCKCQTVILSIYNISCSYQSPIEVTFFKNQRKVKFDFRVQYTSECSLKTTW